MKTLDDSKRAQQHDLVVALCKLVPIPGSRSAEENP